MTGLDTTSLIATLKLQRDALKILYDNLNTLITSSQSGWQTEDNTYYSSIGQASPGFTVETISATNFYPGVTPSLINASVDKYPNVVSYAWRAVPRGSNDDTGEHYNMTLMIEVMVKSHSSEQESNVRIQRTIDCCHKILVDNCRKLGLHEIPAPIKQLGDVFVRREEKSRGDRFFWQGGYLQYAIDKYTKLV